MRHALSAVAVVFWAVQVQAGLVNNGGFEDTADITLSNPIPGWTLADPGDPGLNVSQTFTIGGNTYAPHSGLSFASLGTNGPSEVAGGFLPPPGLNTLSQVITDNPGTSYMLTYWLASDGATDANGAVGPNEFLASWNGTTLAGSDLVNINAQAYTLYTFTVVGTGSDTLAFSERSDNGILSLDDVNLAAPAPTAVPEPGSGLMLLALAALTITGPVCRRRRDISV